MSAVTYHIREEDAKAESARTGLPYAWSELRAFGQDLSRWIVGSEDTLRRYVHPANLKHAPEPWPYSVGYYPGHPESLYHFILDCLMCDQALLCCGHDVYGQKTEHEHNQGWNRFIANLDKYRETGAT